MYNIPIFLLGVTVVAGTYLCKIWKATSTPDRRFPPATKEHWKEHSNVVPYAKFRARRLLQEKAKLDKKARTAAK